MAPLRLILTTAAVGGLTLTAGLAGVPAADAAALSGTTLTISGSPFSGGDCSDVTAPAGVNTPVVAGDTISRSITVSGTATSAADSSDTVILNGTQKVKVTSSASGGQLTSMTITSTTSGSVTAVKGAASNCTTSSDGTGWNLTSGVQGTVHRSTAGWLHVGVHSSGVGGQGVGVQLSTSGGSGILLQSQLGALAVRDIDDNQWVYVPAGDYTLQTTVIGAAATYPAFPKASLNASIALTFYPAGIAKAGETGSAKPMVADPGALTCSTGKAAVRLTSKIAGASKATLYVNGTPKASISNPQARTVAVGVPTNSAVTLKAVVKKAGKTLSATRVYRAC